MERSLGEAREKGGALEGELSALEETLREEQNKNLGLGKRLEEALADSSHLKELQMRLEGALDENRILRDTHESLVEKTLSSASLGSKNSSRTRISSGACAEEEIADLKVKFVQDAERNNSFLTHHTVRVIPLCIFNYES
jgi:hypothetical protein